MSGGDRPTLAEVNAMDEAAFVAALGFAFEHSAWVVRRAHGRRPFASLEALHAAMRDVLAQAPRAERLALIRAHPRLADRAATAGTLTAHSAGEQAAAGLGRLSAATLGRLDRLNAAYEDRFAFPFVICARRHDAASILAAMTRRLAHDEAEEIAAAIDEIGEIGRLRLHDAVAP